MKGTRGREKGEKIDYKQIRDTWYTYENVNGAINFETATQRELIDTLNRFLELEKKIGRGELVSVRKGRKLLKDISKLCIERRRELLQDYRLFREKYQNEV